MAAGWARIANKGCYLFVLPLLSKVASAWLVHVLHGLPGSLPVLGFAAFWLPFRNSYNWETPTNAILMYNKKTILTLPLSFIKGLPMSFGKYSQDHRQ